MKIFVPVLFITVFLMIAPLQAEVLRGQTITWSDFNYSNSIASSISHVYFTTNAGVIRYNKIEARWELPLTGADGLQSNGFQTETPLRVWVSIFDDKLYIETDFSLYEYDILFDRWYPINELPQFEQQGKHIKTPTDLLPSSEMNFVDENSITDRFNRKYQISDVLDDDNGNLWIASWGFGNSIASSSARVMESLPYGLLQKDVSTIYYEDDFLWISGSVGNSYRTGISRYDIEKNEFDYIENGIYQDFPATDIYTISGDESYLFIGSNDGLYIIDRKTKQLESHLDPRNGLFDYSVLAIAPAGDSLFIGTARGLQYMTSESDSISNLFTSEFTNHPIYDLELGEKYLWIASEVGAYRLSLKTGKLHRFNDPTNLLFARVYDIDIYKNSVWFSSESGVISLDLDKGTTTPYPDASRGNRKRSLAVSDDIIALGSDDGLTVIFLNTEKKIERTFTTDDGFPSNYIQVIEIDGDFIWVGSDKGLTRFLWNNPERID